MGLHVSTPELLWTLAAFAGFVLRARALIDAIADVRAAQGGDRAIQLIADGRLREDVIGLVVSGAFMGVGFYAMTQPDPPHLTVGQILLTSVFIVAVSLMTLNSILDARERVLLTEYVRRLGQ